MRRSLALQLWNLAIFVPYRAVLAQLTPLTPGPNETYTAGSVCTIAWKPDASGTWKNVSIDLMSGPNNNMTTVTNVVASLDGTDKKLTPFNWTCPDVNPYSAIYFYQFTNGNNISTRTWTTRFTISSPKNETEPPPNQKQPNGDDVPWGIGQLISKSAQAKTNASESSNHTTGRAASFTTSASSSGESGKRHRYEDGNSSSGDDSRQNHKHGDETRSSDERTGESPTATRMHTARTSEAKSAAARTSDIVHDHISLAVAEASRTKGLEAATSEVSSIRPQAVREGSDIGENGTDTDNDCQCGYGVQSGSTAISDVSIASVIIPVLISALLV